MAASPSFRTPELELTTEKIAGDIVIHGTGKINAASAGLLQSTVRNAIPGSQRIVLDLTAVDYIDSTGLGALVSVYMAARNANCELELSNPKPRVSDLLKLTKLASVFEGHLGGGL
jgi:anti-sigma B factor antagonist